MRNKAFLGLFLLLTIALASFVVAIPNTCRKMDPDVRIINPDTSLEGGVGDVIKGNFTVRNLKNQIIFKDFYASVLIEENGVHSIPNTIISFNPDPVRIGSFDQRRVELSIDLTSTNAYATTYKGFIKIPKEGCADDMFNYQLTVSPSPSMTLEDVSLNIVQGNTGSGTSDADNTGNTDLSVSLSATDLILLSDPSKKIPSSSIFLNPKQTNIDYEESETITVTVNVPSLQTPGTYKGYLVADYDINRKSDGLITTFSILTVVVEQAIPPLIVSVSADPASGYAPLTVQFSSLVSGGVPPYTYAWVFGDNQTSSEPNPQHAYTDAGDYTATLTVTDSNMDTASDSVGVEVLVPELTVSLTAVPTSGYAPLDVDFTIDIDGGVSPYFVILDFGDGSGPATYNTSSNQIMVQHMYNDAGNFTAMVSVTDSKMNTDFDEVGIEVLVPQLDVSVDADPTSGNAPLTVEFTSTVSGGVPPYTYAWDFGDNRTSSEPNPQHTYVYGGNYTATLTITDSEMNTATDNIDIEVIVVPLTVSATAFPTSGYVPLTVQFDAIVSGGIAPYAYHWDFGDNETSSFPSPQHIYKDAGNYTATITITDSIMNTATDSIDIEVLPQINQPPVAVLTAYPTSGRSALTVLFNGSASYDPDGTIEEFSIDIVGPVSDGWAGFGHPGAFNYTFVQVGNYTVTLTVVDNDGAINSTSVGIGVLPPPLVVSITANPTSGYEPLTVQFNSTVTGGVSPYTYYWDFGDSGTSIEANPVHEYILTGNFTATLVVTDMNMETAGDSIHIEVTPSPLLKITSSPGELEVIPGESISTSYTIKNIGNINVTNIVASESVALGLFKLSFDPAVFNLQPNATKTVTIAGYVPENGSGTYHGTVYVKGNEEGASTSFPLTIKIKGRLEITDLDAYVDGDAQKNLNDGDKIKDVKPGSELELKIQVANVFEDDMDIEDIVITATINGIDDGDDLEEETDEFDLEAGEKERKTLIFDIPEDAGEDDYTLEIEVEGKDENGVSHKVKWYLTVELDREKHDIKIREARLSPSIISCTRHTTLTTSLINIGEKDEDDVVLEVKGSALSIDERYELEMGADPDDDDNRITKTFDISIPDDFPTGTYSIELNAYYQTDKLSDSETVELTVKGCGAVGEEEETPPKEEEKEEAAKEETELVYITPTGGAVVEPTGIMEESTYSVILAIITIVLLAVVIYLVIRLIVKR